MVTSNITRSPKSIQRKLQFLATVSVALAVVLTCTALVTYGVINLRNSKWRQVQTQAELLSLNSAAAVEFADSVQADRLLDALRVERSVTAAAIFSKDGDLIGGYPSRDAVANSFVLEKSNEAGHLLTHAITADGERIGDLRVAVDFSTVREEVINYARITIIVGVFSLLFSVAVAGYLNRSIVRPIHALVAVSRKVTLEGNYTYRVETKSAPEHDGELGELVVAFNEMLSVVESSKKSLQDANDYLEHRVATRTEELEKACEAAKAASRAKSDFLANMSHEIRTPLNAIMGYADLLCRGLDDSPEERADMLKTIHSSGRHLMIVINDILDISKIEAGRLELDIQPDSPQRILSEVVSMMRVPFREKNLSLEYTWQGPVPNAIQTDGSRLRQILINLVGNAKKFTMNGGVHIIAKLLNPGTQSKLEIEVIDTGVGIQKDKFEQIFHPFMQEDTSVTRKYGGSGLGLSISRQLARMMGGDLTVESDNGRGSCFRLTLDAGDLKSEDLIENGAIGDSLPTPVKQSFSIDGELLRGLRVLVVDDGATNRKLVSLVLGRSGACISQAENGKQAYDLILSENAFDVVLMDMQMPILDGYAATKMLRNSGITVPIIALTAHAMASDKQLCLEAGCSDYLSKPINTDELLIRLRRIYEDTRPTTREIRRVESLSPINSKLPTDDSEFAEIVVDFVAALERETVKLRDAVDTRDSKQTQSIAHWVKGSGGTAGFPCLTAPAMQLHDSVQANDWENAEKLLLTIEDYLSRLVSPNLESN